MNYGQLCDGCQTFVLVNSSHKCRSLFDQFEIENNSPYNSAEDTPTPIKLNKYNFIKSKNDEPNLLLHNSLPTVSKKLQNNTGSLAMSSDFNDMLASNVNYKKSENGVAKQDISKLIEVIETCAPPWNFKLSLGERSDGVKANLWNRKYSIPALQKSWKYLKEKYTREKKIPPSGSAACKKEWPHLRSLQFLDDVVLCKKRTTDSISSTCEEFDIDQPPRQKKKLLMEDHMSDLIDELKNSRPIPPTPPKPEPRNEDRDFCSYLTSLMAGLPRNAKLRLQHTFISMVFEQIE
ncbi:MADF domain-containing protein [Aphis craccivora]|uniref:MADF domain-containing protein n=1 Tax=Aphis craccivora TaxID=307492 RepID=A0A6G0WBI3_APHCR|nr:MADF domain-containing protein [Aphis craccivora]